MNAHFDNSAVMLRNVMQKYTYVCVVFSGYISFAIVMNQLAYKSNSRNDLEKLSSSRVTDFICNLKLPKSFY